MEKNEKNPAIGIALSVVRVEARRGMVCGLRVGSENLGNGKGKINAASVAARRKKRTTKKVFLRRQVEIVERSVGWIEPGEVLGFGGRRSSCSLRGWNCGKNGEARTEAFSFCPLRPALLGARYIQKLLAC